MLGRWGEVLFQSLGLYLGAPLRGTKSRMPPWQMRAVHWELPMNMQVLMFGKLNA